MRTKLFVVATLGIALANAALFLAGLHSGDPVWYIAVATMLAGSVACLLFLGVAPRWHNGIPKALLAAGTFLIIGAATPAWAASQNEARLDHYPNLTLSDVPNWVWYAVFATIGLVVVGYVLAALWADRQAHRSQDFPKALLAVGMFLAASIATPAWALDGVYNVLYNAFAGIPTNLAIGCAMVALVILPVIFLGGWRLIKIARRTQEQARLHGPSTNIDD